TVAGGTVMSVDMDVPTGFSISGNPITSSGTLKLGFSSGYSLPTNTKQSSWDAKAELSDINNGTLTLSTGSLLTGSGSFSANQSSNSSITLDLSQATKDKINNGVQDLQSVTDNGNITTNGI